MIEYEGTLYDKEDLYCMGLRGGKTTAMQKQVEELLSKGKIVGIATVESYTSYRRVKHLTRIVFYPRKKDERPC